VAQYTDAQIKEMYEDLKTSDPTAAPDKNPNPQKWTAAEFSTALGYTRRVAKSHTLDEFNQFVRTGQPIHPVKMTPAEMEVLMGGSPFHSWAQTGLAAVGVAVAVAAICN
jgi:hypothetical protein